MFIKAHRELHSIMVVKAVAPDCGWVWAESRAKFLERAAVRSAGDKGSEVLAFLTEAEIVSEDVGVHRYCA